VVDAKTKELLFLLAGTAGTLVVFGGSLYCLFLLDFSATTVVCIWASWMALVWYLA